MTSSQISHTTSPSKLEKFTLNFEINRTVTEERRATKLRRI